MNDIFRLLQPLKIVGFYGDGYLEHPAFTLRKTYSILSFSFRTMQEAAVLLLSTFEGHEDRLSRENAAKEEENVRTIHMIPRCLVFTSKFIKKL